MDAHNYAYMDELFLESYRALDQLPLLQHREPAAETFSNGIVLPCQEDASGKHAGVLAEDSTYVELSAFPALSPVDSWGGSYGQLSQATLGSLSTVHRRVMYLGRLWWHWGHFLMDLIPRLWYTLEQDPEVLIAFDGQELPQGVYREFFSLAGVRPSQFVHVDTPMRFDEVVVPECSHVPGRFVLPAFARIFDRVAEQAVSALPTKSLKNFAGRPVYLTRTGIQKKFPTEFGEQSIENLMRANGFVIVSPEQLSLPEQIATIRLASEVACLSGTLPHTMMFARDGAKLTVFRKSNKPVYRQFSVDQVRSLEVTHVDAHVSLHPVGASGPFVVTINDNVRRWAADRGFDVPESRSRSATLRKLHLAQYLPLYMYRNHSKNHEVPLFIDGQFTTTPTAKRELSRWYRHAR